MKLSCLFWREIKILIFCLRTRCYAYVVGVDVFQFLSFHPRIITLLICFGGLGCLNSISKNDSSLLPFLFILWQLGSRHMEHFRSKMLWHSTSLTKVPFFLLHLIILSMALKRPWQYRKVYSCLYSEHAQIDLTCILLYASWRLIFDSEYQKCIQR